MKRLVLGLTLLTLTLGVLCAWLMFKTDPWKDRTKTAEMQSGLNVQTGAIADRASETTARIIVQSEPLAHAVATAPGADAPLPPAVRDSHAAAIGGLRDARASGATDSPSEPAR